MGIGGIGVPSVVVFMARERATDVPERGPAARSVNGDLRGDFPTGAGEMAGKGAATAGGALEGPGR